MRILHLYSSDVGRIKTTNHHSFKPHATPVSVTAIDRTGTLVATGGKDGVTKVWDVRRGYLTHNLRGPGVPVSSLHFLEPQIHITALKSDTESRGPSDSLMLVTGFQDGKVRVFDLHDNNIVVKLDSHVADVQGIDYSPDQNALVTASRDRTVMWWDARSWKLRKVQPVFEMVESVGFIGDGRVVFSAGSKGCLRLWESDTGRELTDEQEGKSEEKAIISAIYRPSQNFILCVQLDHTLSFYRVSQIHEHVPLPTLPACSPFRWISGTHDEIIDLAYLLPDKSAMALATNSEDIRIVSTENRRDPENSHQLAAYFGQDIGILTGHKEIVIALDVDWSGHWVATGAKDNTAKLWKVDVESCNFTCHATFAGHAQSVGAVALPKATPPQSSAAYSSPLDHPPPFLITGSEDQTIKRWDIPRKAAKASNEPIRAAFTKKAHEKDINALDVHHASLLFASGSQDKTVKVLSCQEGEIQGVLRGHMRGVWTVKFAPKNTPSITEDGGGAAKKGAILTGSGDKTVKIWSLSDYSCLRTFSGHTHSVLKVAWLNIPPPGEGKKPLLVASSSGDGLVMLWDVNSDGVECSLDNHDDRVWALAVHPDNNTLVSGGADGVVTFWKDTTSETQAAEAEAVLQLVEQEQELENHMHSGSYREAITLALQLDHPGRLLSIFKSVANTQKPDPGSYSGLKAVDDVLANLSEEQMYLLLCRLRDWNTNKRVSLVAHKILWTLTKSYPASRFVNLMAGKGNETVAVQVHSTRHSKRIENVVDENFFIDYMLQQMGSVFPDASGPSSNGIEADGDVIMF